MRLRPDLMSKSKRNLLVALGSIVVAINKCEATAMIGFALVTKMDLKMTQSILAQESMEGMFSILDSIVALNPKGEDQLKEFNSLLIKMREINQRRNAIIHSNIVLGFEDSLIKIKYYKGKKGKPVRTESTEMSVNELMSFVDEIYDANNKMRDHFVKYYPQK